MTRREGKKRELADIDAFVRRWPEWRDGPPEIKESEPPDAMLLFPARTIGLEHTAPVVEQLAKGNAIIRHCTARVKADLREASIEARVHMSFSCTAAAATPARQVARNVTAIVKLARSVVQRGRAIAPTQAQLRRLGICNLARLKIEPRPGKEGTATWAWSSQVQGKWLVTRAITEKTAMLPSYRAAHPEATEFWLLIVSDRGPGAPDPDDAQLAEVVPGFDRVFFLFRRRDHESVYELSSPIEQA